MKPISLFALLVLAVGTSTAAHAQTKKPTAKAMEKPNLVCPVMDSKIASVKAASGKSVYKGKTYYFCCGGCKPAFDKNPAKYVKAETKPAPTRKKM